MRHLRFPAFGYLIAAVLRRVDIHPLTVSGSGSANPVMVFTLGDSLPDSG